MKNSVVEEIKERLDIIDVISAYTPLRKAGRSYKGLCPFHQEKTPSFVVFPETGTWHCFGACGTGGDVFTFIMKKENVDFRDALEILAQRAGVELEAPSAAQSERERNLDKLREINQSAALYFHNCLRNASEAQAGRDYLAGRGLDDATIDAFQMGFALDSWDALLKHLASRNYQLTDILSAGLIIAKEHDDGRISHYDRFRNRIVVPIRDVRGRVIGFGGRVLAKDQQPKYLNTPQTPLFDKSSVLFGLDMARKEIRGRDQAIIVEGYMDVLAAHQFGETNVIASMGTALTEQQLKQLKRYTNTFILALDADTAGQAATLRGINQAREALDREWVPTVTATGLLRHEARLSAQLRIMALPEGQDPDDVIRADPGQWQRLVDSALPVVDYFFDLVQRDLDMTNAQDKSQAVERLAPLIREVADEIQRTHYVQQLARLIQTNERTVERLILSKPQPLPAPLPRVETPPPTIWEDADEEDAFWAPGMEEEAPASPAKAMPVSRPAPLPAGPATHCLARLISRPQLLSQVQSDLMDLGASPLDEDDFDRAEERAICTALLSGLIREDGGWPDVDPALRPQIDQLCQRGQTEPELTRQQIIEDIVAAVLRLRIANLKTHTRQLPALVQAAEQEGSVEEARAYRRMQVDLGRQMQALLRAANARTLNGKRQTLPNF